MTSSAEIKDLAAALSKAQSEIIGAMADSLNPFYKSNYADLASVWAAIRIPLTNNGLSVVQVPKPHENGVEIESILLHSSGQFISGSLFMPSEKLDPQSFGKLCTYIRRYSLTALVGVPQLDDDGESAMRREIEIKEVSQIQQEKSKVEIKKSELDTQKEIEPHDCQWLVSKFNNKQEYCPKCKAKRERSA